MLQNNTINKFQHFPFHLVTAAAAKAAVLQNLYILVLFFLLILITLQE
jgi:hypothetical protein